MADPQVVKERTGELEASLEGVLSHPTSPSQDIDCNLTSEQDLNEPRNWKWGPGATSEDAARFYRSVL